MVISKKTIAKIKEIVKKKHAKLGITLLGNSIYTRSELNALKKQGIDISNTTSLMDLAYNHNFVNTEGNPTNPTSVEDMTAQQSVPGIKPEGEAHDYAVEHSNENVAQLIEKMSTDVSTKLEGLIRESNNQYKSNALQNLDRSDAADELVKEGMIGQIKGKLRDAANDSGRDWHRVATTEISNVIGIGSTDRIVAKNRAKSMDDVFVYRIAIIDAKTCKYCKRFYIDADGSPKVYKLSTLLSNGSNYGKKTADWAPVVVATHPNERCSQMIEVPPGYKVQVGGKLTYIGLSAWNDYIVDKIEA